MLMKQTLPNLPPPSSYRIGQAQEIYQDLQEMTELTYIADTILAYLQSSSFFVLIILIMVYRLVRQYVQRKKG